MKSKFQANVTNMAKNAFFDLDLHINGIFLFHFFWCFVLRLTPSLNM